MGLDGYTEITLPELAQIPNKIARKFGPRKRKPFVAMTRFMLWTMWLKAKMAGQDMTKPIVVSQKEIKRMAGKFGDKE